MTLWVTNLLNNFIINNENVYKVYESEFVCRVKQTAVNRDF